MVQVAVHRLGLELKKTNLKSKKRTGYCVRSLSFVFPSPPLLAPRPPLGLRLGGGGDWCKSIPILTCAWHAAR